MYDFSTREARVKFIAEMESSAYSGTDADGGEVVVFIQKGVGMEVQTEHKNKPGWLECVFYDQDGFQEGVRYKRV